MNIIKLKDIIKPDDTYFNEHLKGKYAFFVNMKYIVSFDDLTVKKYIDIEQGNSSLDIKHYQATDISDYIDQSTTAQLNSIHKYEISNKYVTSPNLDIEDIKVFRTWLAQELLPMDEYDEDVKHMLDYYANNMYDETIKYLNIFGKPILEVQLKQQGCSCCGGIIDNSQMFTDQLNNYGCPSCNGSTDLSNLYKNVLTNCDCVKTYKQGIYRLMVNTFSNINFWINKDEGFLKLFKEYVDNIITLNLPFTNTSFNFIDCGCQQGSQDDYYYTILRNLSRSLQYIIDNQTNEHKLYIQDAFSAWSKYLYEIMYWA